MTYKWLLLNGQIYVTAVSMSYHYWYLGLHDEANGQMPRVFFFWIHLLAIATFTLVTPFKKSSMVGLEHVYFFLKLFADLSLEKHGKVWQMGWV